MKPSDDSGAASALTIAPAPAGGARRPPLRPTRSMLALESRIVFDGAVHAALAEAHDGAAAPHRPAIAGQAHPQAHAHIQPQLRPDAADTAKAAALPPQRAAVDSTARAAAAPTTILFIDASVQHPETLLAGVKAGVEVVMLDKNSDGVQQITDALKGRHNLDSIQIISEGSTGRVILGASALSDSNVDSYKTALAGWGAALHSGGDLLLFGCDVAHNPTGEHFINRLAALTGADVAASSDATGAAARGGNWTLERHTGQIEADKAIGERALDAYDGLLLSGNGTADGTYDFGGNLGSPSGGYSKLNDKLLVSDNLTQDPGTTILYAADANATIDGADFTAVFKAEGTTVAKHFTFNDFAISAYDHARTVDKITVVLADVNGNTIATLQMQAASLVLGTTATQLSTLINGGVAWSYANVATVTLTLSFWKTTDPGHNGDGGSPSEFNLESITMSNISATSNVAPTFVGAVTNLAVPQNGGTFDVRSLLHVSDTDTGQTETWSVSGAPAHGTLSLSGASSASGSTDIGPGGTITYTPAAGFAGTDSFTIQVSDGTTTTTRTINVSVAPATPGTPDLAAASDSGPSSTDNVTNGASLSFSGTSGASDTTSVVRVFIDVNADGVYTPGTDTSATATVANGAWTVSGVSTVGVADGVYNVYAVTTSAAGAVSSARSSGLAVTIDKTAPGAPSNAIGLLAGSDSGGSNSDRVTNVGNPTVRVSLVGSGAGTNNVVELLLGGAALGTPTRHTLTGTDVANGYVDLTVTSGDLGADGAKVLTARFTDVAGNVGGAGGAVTVTLDTTAPAAPATPALDSGSDSGSSNADRITNVATPLITGTAESGSTVTLYDSDGVTVLGTAVASGGAWSITSTTLGAGLHTLRAKAVDAAGNISAASSTLSVTVDTSAPATPPLPTLASASDSGASNSDRVTNVTTPAITGTAESGSTVTLYDSDGVTVLGSAVATGGAWSITSSTLSAGAHNLTVKATDTAGNVSAASSALAISIDTGAPAAPATPALASASDSGASNSDRITSVTTPVLNGTAENGSTVTLYDTDGTTVLGSAVASGGAWSITSSALGAGVHTLTVKATDAAGNVSAASGALSVTIDTGAPAAPATPTLASASDSGSANSDRITNVTTPVISGTAESGSTVTLYDTDGTTVLGSAVASGGVWSITSSALGAGAHTLTAKATDAAGNVSAASGALAITVDTSAPAAPPAPTLDSASDSGTPNDGVTNIGMPVINGTAESGSTVTLYDTDGTTVLGTAVAVGGSWSITSGTLGMGAHTLTVKATDAAGNVSAASAALSVTIDASAPATPPAPALASASDSGASNADRVTNATTPLLTGTADSGSTVNLYDSDGTTVLGATVATGGVWSITSAALADGVHNLTVKATNGGGISSAASAALTLTIDTLAPAAAAAPTLAAASDSGSSNTDRITNVSTPVLTGTAENGSTVTLYDSDGSTVLGTAVASGGAWSITSAALGEGAHNLSVKTTDIAGNTSAASAALAVTIDTVAPAMLITSANANPLTGGETVLLTFTLSEPSSNFTLADIAVTGGTLARFSGSGSVYTVRFTAGADANVPIRISVATGQFSDAAGNTNPAASALQLARAGVAPVLAAPATLALAAGSDTGASATDGVTSVTRPVVSGSAADGVRVTLYDSDGVTVLGSAIASGGSWSITSAALGEGSHTLTARASDSNGNISAASAALAVRIDASAPAAAGTPQLAGGGNATTSNTPALSGSAEANSTVTVRSDGVVIGTAQADANGNWSLSAQLSLGTHQISASATDAAGNSGPASAALTLNVLAPPLPILTAPAAPTAPPALVLAPTAAPAPDATAPVRDAAFAQVGQSPLASVIDVASGRSGGAGLSAGLSADGGAAAAPAATATALPAGAVALQLSREIGNVSLGAQQSLNFAIPRDTFLSADGARPLLTASLANGAPLPDWLRFDPVSGTFSGTPPPGTVIALEIAVVARDASGNEVRAVFKLQGGAAGKVPAAAPPQASLSGNDLLLALGLRQRDAHLVAAATPAWHGDDGGADGDGAHGGDGASADAATSAPETAAATASASQTGAMSAQLARQAQRFAHQASATLRHLAEL